VFDPHHVPPALVGGLVAAAGLSVLGLHAVTGVRAYVHTQHPVFVDPSAPAWARNEGTWYRCMERRLHAKVPSGSRVFVSPKQPLLYVERLTEWSTPTTTVVTRPDDANYVVRFVHAQNAPCLGYDVEAQPR
jgi:hypothetical protein